MKGKRKAPAGTGRRATATGRKTRPRPAVRAAKRTKKEKPARKRGTAGARVGASGPGKAPVPPRKASARKTAAAPSSAPTAVPEAPFAHQSPGQVLAAFVSLSRAVNADMRESDLARVVYDTLLALLPGRMVAVRTFNPKTLVTSAILADAALVENASLLPITVERGGLEHQNVRENLPADDRQPREGVRIAVVDQHPLIFRDAVAGFSVPLLAGGEISGELHVNYPASPSLADIESTLRQDKGLVIPIANHIAVVAHTRRLLRETSYLRDYLEHLIDQANVLIVATDIAGRVTVWNRAMTRLTGFARNEAVGKDLVTWLTSQASPQLGLVMRQVAATGETATRELRLSSAGGAVLRAAFNVAIVKQGNQPAAVLAVGQDVTALRALQSQVLHAEKLATLGQIAAGVAHEINNPLTSIQVCAEAVARKAAMAREGRVPNAFDDSDLDRLAKIKEGAERIRRFARDLVSYARPSGTERQEVSINELVEQALSFCEHTLDEHKVKLEVDFHPELPRIHAIRDQLMQVFINLVNNAAQALPKGGGMVRLRTWKKGRGAVGVAISDSGKGIRDADRAHVFEPFFSTKEPGRGTGLGLSIVRNIVYSHGGQITFQSRYGGGTTFVLTLPVTGTPEGADGEEEA